MAHLLPVETSPGALLCKVLPSASADKPGTLVPSPDTPLMVTFRSALCSVTAAEGGPAQGVKGLAGS